MQHSEHDVLLFRHAYMSVQITACDLKLLQMENVRLSGMAGYVAYKLHFPGMHRVLMTCV